MTGARHGRWSAAHRQRCHLGAGDGQSVHIVFRRRRLITLLSVFVLAAGCRGAPGTPASTPPNGSASAISLSTPAASPGERTPRPVALIVMENHEAGQILGNAGAPYLNGLAAHVTVETAYYAVAHPSLPNYLALIGGDTFGITSDCTSCTVSATNLADQLEAAGRTWKAYMEDMPAPCGLQDSGRYAVKHDPFVYFHDIRGNPARCRAHVVPFSQLSQDLTAGQLPDFLWITPNLCNDMHDCSVQTGDRWLSTVVPELLQAPQMQRGAVIITWDEGTSNAGCCGAAGGGRVLALIATPAGTAGSDSTPASHYSLLRTIEAWYGLPPLGQAAGASPLLPAR